MRIVHGQALKVCAREVVDRCEDEDERMVRCQPTGLREHRSGLRDSFGTVVRSGERHGGHDGKGVELLGLLDFPDR